MFMTVKDVDLITGIKPVKNSQKSQASWSKTPKSPACQTPSKRSLLLELNLKSAICEILRIPKNIFAP